MTLSLVRAPGVTVLVTGTDSCVGKTFVGAALGRLLTRMGVRVIGIKAVETGCPSDVSREEDGAVLAAATGQGDPTAALVRLRSPLCPPLAAEAEETPLGLQPLAERIRGRARVADVVLVEGTGGVLSPLTLTETALELARLCDARALVVAADRRGAVNHTLLTLEALRSDGIECIGVVLTAPAVPDETTGRNAGLLRRFAGLSRLAELPRLSGWEEAAHHLHEVARWILP